jgi:hypothetical protein
MRSPDHKLIRGDDGQRLVGVQVRLDPVKLEVCGNGPPHIYIHIGYTGAFEA